MRSFELVQLDGTDLPPFTPGAHIKVQMPSGQVRKYSLCNAPEERRHYLITVEREAAGEGGSKSLTEDACEGHTLPSSVPDNIFPLVESAKAYLFIVGGIGITPIMAMIRSFGELSGLLTAATGVFVMPLVPNLQSLRLAKDLSVAVFDPWL